MSKVYLRLCKLLNSTCKLLGFYTALTPQCENHFEYLRMFARVLRRIQLSVKYPNVSPVVSKLVSDTGVGSDSDLGHQTVLFDDVYYVYPPNPDLNDIVFQKDIS